MVVRIREQKLRAISFQNFLGAMMCLLVMKDVTAVQGKKILVNPDLEIVKILRILDL